jgi:MFS family permease
MPAAGRSARPVRKGLGMAVTKTEGTRTLLAGGVAAIVFAVLFVVGFLLNTNTPEGDESNSEWVRHFADSGNRRMMVIGAILLALAALAFLIFLGALREQLRTAAPGTEWLSTIAFASGIVFVAMMGVFAVGVASVAAGIVFGDNPVPRDANIMRSLDSLGFGALLLFGAGAAGLMIITASVVSGRAALLPRWLVVTGYVVGVIVLLGGLIFFPLALFVLWMLAVGIVMISRSRVAA